MYRNHDEGCWCSILGETSKVHRCNWRWDYSRILWGITNQNTTHTVDSQEIQSTYWDLSLTWREHINCSNIWHLMMTCTPWKRWRKGITNCISLPNAMRLNLEELRYLVKVLETTDSFTIARGEQIDHPTVSHQKLKDKVKQDIRRLTNWPCLDVVGFFCV